jgi:hypothetical protein
MQSLAGAGRLLSSICLRLVCLSGLPTSQRFRMSQSASASALGFLTVVEQADLGLLGGFLILNAAGRPLEFHCTAPVKWTRPQEILYGPTLRPFLYGERIATALLKKAKAEIALICTDQPDVLAAREETSQPIALVLAANAASLTEMISWRQGDNSLAVPRLRKDDQARINQLLGESLTALDLNEPFARIREALEEAQKSLRNQAA